MKTRISKLIFFFLFCHSTFTEAQTPVAGFGVDKVQGFITDTFRFSDISLNALMPAHN